MPDKIIKRPELFSILNRIHYFEKSKFNFQKKNKIKS